MVTILLLPIWHDRRDRLHDRLIMVVPMMVQTHFFQQKSNIIGLSSYTYFPL